MKKFTLIFTLLVTTVTMAMAQLNQSWVEGGSSWSAIDPIPDGVTAITSAGGYTTATGMETLVTANGGDVVVTLTYAGGNHKLNIVGVDLVATDGTVAYSDYHHGTTGGNHNNNVYTLSGVEAGDYILRYFVTDGGSDGDNIAYNRGTIVATGVVERHEAVEPEEPEALKPVVSFDADVLGTMPYKLSDEDAAKVFELSTLTVAVKVTTPATMSGRKVLLCTSDPTANANTDAMPTGSAYVGYGFNNYDLGYLASSKEGDRYTANVGITGSTEYVVVYVLNPSGNNYKSYVNGTKHVDRHFGTYEIATPKMVKEDHANACIYIGGGMTAEGARETFEGTISGVQVYDGELTAEQIAGLFPEEPEAPVYTASVTMNPATLGATDVAAWSTVENNVATFTAQVYNDKYEFVGWTNGTETVSTDLVYTVTLTENLELVANFQKKVVAYTASVTMNPATLPMTDVAAWSTVENNVATFTAQVYNDKYEFVGWTNGTETVSTDLVYTVTLTENLELVANFQEKATEPEAPAYDWAGEYTVNATVADETDNWTTPSPLTMKIFYDEAAAAYKLESFAGADIKAASGTYGYYPTVSVSADNSRVATININSGIYLASEAVMGEEIWSKSTLLRAKDGSKTVTLTVDENGVMSIPDMEIVYDVLMSDFSTHQITVLSTLIGVTATKPASIASTEALEALKASIDEAVGLLATVEFTLNDVETAIDLASNADKMLYSNAPCTDTSWGDEFKSWAVLFDDKTETIFHSEYKSGATSLDGNEHYIRVDLGDDALSRFSFTITTRSKNCEVNSPTEMVVEGCNEENGEYTEIATVNDIPQQNSYKYVSNVFTTAEAYRYIRFRVTKTGSMQKDAGGKVFFFISEFGLNKVAPVPSVAEAYTSIINDVTALNTAKAAAETLHSAESPLAAEVEAASVALSSAIETVKNALPGEPETPAEAVVLDFTTNVWAIPGQYGENYTTKYNTEASYTDGTYTVTLAPGTANKANYFYPESNDQIKNALCLKNTGSKIVLPAFDFAVAKIEVVGHESATSYANADMNVFVGGNAVSTACKGSTGTNVFAIAADAQAAGSVYELVVGEAGGAYSSIRYITKINIYPASEGGVEPIELAAPVLGDENTKKYFDLYARIPVKATFPENATETAIYYTTNGDEPTKDSHKVASGSSVSISSYVGTTIKAVAYCVVDGKEYFSEVATATYYEAVTALYEMAGAVEAGKQYLFVANMGTAYSAMTPAEGTTTKTIAGGEVKVNDMFAEALNFFAFTLEAQATSASYKIKDATGMYLGIDGMSASFIVSETGQNVATSMVSYDWTVSFDDSGFATIQNSGRTLALVGTSWKTVTNVTATDVLPQLFVAREYPTLVVTPDNKENQEQLTEFVISCETGLGIDEEAGEIVVRDQGAYEQVVVNPGTDDEYTEYQMVYKYFEFTAKMNDEGTAYTITLNEPITESGSYELVVPEGFFIVEPTGYAQPSEAINNYYTIVSNEPLVVENVTPTDGSTVASLKYLVVDFSENVYDVYIWNFDVKDEGGNVVTTATPGFQDENGGWFSDFSWASLSLEQEITEAGTYTITIPAGAIGAEADPSKMNSEIVLTFTVDPATGINGVDAENGEAVIYDITGRKIEQITAPGIYIVNGKKVLVK